MARATRPGCQCGTRSKTGATANEAYVAKICRLPFEAAPESIVSYHAGAAHAILGKC